MAKHWLLRVGLQVQIVKIGLNIQAVAAIKPASLLTVSHHFIKAEELGWAVPDNQLDHQRALAGGLLMLQNLAPGLGKMAKEKLAWLNLLPGQWPSVELKETEAAPWIVKAAIGDQGGLYLPTGPVQQLAKGMHILGAMCLGSQQPAQGILGLSGQVRNLAAWLAGWRFQLRSGLSDWQGEQEE